MITELITEYNMLPRGTRVMVALSGGRDSMCLLHMLLTLRESLGIEVCAAHYNHGLRGEESDSDCEFARSWCKEHDIAFVSEKGNVRDYADRNGMGIEDAARRLRYDFLRRSAGSMGCQKIATAHNADDNAETMLMNLMRGCGLKGICGIPPVREEIIRPLLGTSRAEINEYVAKNGIPYVEDSSNAGDDYTRNRIRHSVMPALKELEPDFPQAAFRASQLFIQDESCLDAMARDFIAKYYRDKALPCDELSALPEAVSARVFRIICGRGLSSNHVDSIRGIVCGGGLAFADVPGMRIKRDRGRLYFGQEETKLGEYHVSAGESIFIEDAGIEIKTEIIDSYSGKIYSKFNMLDFNSVDICGKIIVTSRREGDKLKINGRGCTKSLKALFSERGMTQHERDMTPVFRDERGVIAVAGFGVSERCAAKKGEKALRITIIKKEKTGENYRDE